MRVLGSGDGKEQFDATSGVEVGPICVGRGWVKRNPFSDTPVLSGCFGRKIYFP